MGKKYKSKVNDLWIWACGLILLLFGVFLLCFPATVICGVLLLAVGCLLPLGMLLGSWYSMEEEYLFIRCLGIETYRIPYGDILNVTSVRNHEKDKSPALSPDRIRVDYKKDGKITWVHISPRRREEFQEILRKKVYQTNQRCG
ncbi:MAG: PH domain-containing protein [Blautia sp.]|jgi:hypothetical protein